MKMGANNIIALAAGFLLIATTSDCCIAGDRGMDPSKVAPAPAATAGLSWEATEMRKTLGSGERVDVIYKAVNKTDSPISVKELKASCTCVTAHASTSTVAPGKALEVTLSHSGTFGTADEKQVAVTTDRGTTLLRLSIIIVDTLSVAPRFLDWKEKEKDGKAVTLSFREKTELRSVAIVYADGTRRELQPVQDSASPLSYHLNVALPSSKPGDLTTARLEISSVPETPTQPRLYIRTAQPQP
ncbi:hypothetical protein DB346_13645 [Verrucomicrobia bacterium LW23]|nr:hypothetical protein DB346_13645 [Verrucomicrobia bacterium LW23]